MVPLNWLLGYVRVHKDARVMKEEEGVEYTIACGNPNNIKELLSCSIAGSGASFVSFSMPTTPGNVLCIPVTYLHLTCVSRLEMCFGPVLFVV